MRNYRPGGFRVTTEGSEMSTAQLRNEGYDAARRLDFAEAARLYNAAADAYPMTGSLAKKDIAKLRMWASTYTQAAEYEAKRALSKDVA